MSQVENKKSTLSIVEIRNILTFLQSKLPKNPTATKVPYILPFNIKDNLIYQDDLVVNLQRIADHLGYYLLILKKVLVLYYDIPIDGKEKVFTCDTKGSILVHDNYSDAAGYYSNVSPDVQIVTIHKKRGYKMKHLIGILVHEMMHHYLNQLNIRKNDTIENEKLTDIACAYLGVGHLLLEAYSPIEWTSDHWERNNQSGHTIHRTWIGYVTTETLRDTLSLSTELRELSPNQVVKSIVSSSDRSIMRVKLFKYRFLLFRKLVRESINKNTKVILQSKHSKVDLMCNELLKINYDLVKSLDLLTKNNLEKLSFKNGPNIVNIVNSLAVGKFENEIFNLKLNLSKNIIFVPRITLKKLNEIEEQLNEAVQLFRRLRNN